jgi:GNAT superfamily N-acetyltransferase
LRYETQHNRWGSTQPTRNWTFRQALNKDHAAERSESGPLNNDAGKLLSAGADLLMAEFLFHQVEDAEHKQLAGALIREYLEWLNRIVQRDYGIGFDVEAMVASDLSDPDKFHPPGGRFYLVEYDGAVAGVGCLKKLEAGVGEIQRMYVPPKLRGRGVGRAIVSRLIEDARSIGYHRLKLESLEFLAAAHSLYRSVGFHEIDPYADNSMKSYQNAANLDKYYSITVFMEMDL